MPIELDDLVRTGPGTIAGRYLRSFWQPVMRSEDLLPGNAHPVRIMSEDFTLYRGHSGKAQLVAARCPHRLTRLHMGWVEGDDIRCLYHGWKFDADGQCVHQPGEREAFTRSTRIASFPTEEYLGLVWCYLGEGHAPPMRRYPDFERPGLLSVGIPERWPCNFFNRLDNATDLFHVLATHRETMAREANVAPQGVDGGWLAPECKFAETDYGIETTMKGASGSTSYFHFLMPNTNAIAAHTGRVEGFRDGSRQWKAEMFIRVPIDDEHCVSFPMALIDVHGEEAERVRAQRDKARRELDAEALIERQAQAIIAGTMRIGDMDPRMSAFYSFLVEDYACQVGQGPIADRANERLGQIDQGVVMLRRMWMRELTAFAEGRPTKPWAVPQGLIDKTEPQPSLAAGQPSALLSTQSHPESA
ncbi:MAG: Rieske 2Fe-2S domain-containing protein [Burkholderiaceae bacterium]